MMFDMQTGSLEDDLDLFPFMFLDTTFVLS